MSVPSAQDSASTTTRLAVGMAVVGGLAVIGAAVLLVGGPRDGPPSNVFVNEPGHVHSHNTPSVARNPTDPDNVVLVHRLDRPAFDAVLSWSTDGGQSWQATALPLPADRDRPYGPDAAFGPDGTLYVTYVNLTGQGNTPETLWLVRSEDGGRSVSEPVEVAGELALQSRVAVDPDGVVHVTWLQATDVALLAITRPPVVLAARSTDGGATFTEPVAVSDPDRERIGAASPVVDADGDVVVLYQDFRDNRRDFQNLEGPPWDGPSALVLSRSEDGGATFSAGVELEDGVIGTRRFLVFLPEFPSLAGGPEGELYAAWTDGRHGDEDVLLRRSDDGGRSWSAAVRVNDNPRGDGTDQYLPRVAVAPDGRLDVLYYDRSQDPANTMMHTTLASSTDGGTTFRYQQVSTQAFDARVGPVAGPHLPPDLGSRLGLVSDADRVLAAWTDTRLGDEASARQDVVVAEIVDPAGGGTPWAALGAVLVAAAGTTLLARRRLTSTKTAALETYGLEAKNI